MNESATVLKGPNAKKDASHKSSAKVAAKDANQPVKSPSADFGPLRDAIHNVRRNEQNPSIDTISAELISMSQEKRTSTLQALQQTHGNRYVQKLVSRAEPKSSEHPAGMLPPGLTKSASERSFAPVGGGILQRKCDKCQEDEKLLQRSAVGSAPETVPPIVHEVLRSPGQPLDAETRAFMEPRFGNAFSWAPVQADTPKHSDRLSISQAEDRYEHEAESAAEQVMRVPTPSAASRLRDFSDYNFSQVRVHTDAQAAESARAVNALAYTVGHNIAFGAGQYEPETSKGRSLLAHELVHVIRHRNGFVSRQIFSQVTSSAEAPGLSRNTVQSAHEAIARADLQRAIDVIVDELVRNGKIDRTKLYHGRVKYRSGLGGEGLTTGRNFFHEARTGELTALSRRLEIGNDAFHSVPWLYSSILHEYQHAIQFETQAGLRTIGSVVPGQQTAKLHDKQRDVEAYATEILHAHETGVDQYPFDVRDLWERLHDAWSYLDTAKKQPLKDLYREAHANSERIPGVGLLRHFTPIP